MGSLTFKIEESKKMLLETVAKSMNVSVDDLLNKAIDDFLKEKEKHFQEARTYVRKRYNNLYKRLA